MGQGISTEFTDQAIQELASRPASIHGTSSSGIDTVAAAAGLPERETDHQVLRVISWEVSIAKGVISSFNKMLTAHALILSLLVTVNLTAFFQPPRGWQGDSGRMFPHSRGLISFSFFNSVSLCTGISGLLFYIYCSLSSIVSLHWVPLPDRFDDPVSVHLLHNLRASLRWVVLPTIKRRCNILFLVTVGALLLSTIAYIAGGLVSTHTGHFDSIFGVIVPMALGGIGMLFAGLLSYRKLTLELDFETRFSRLWSHLGGIKVRDPGVRPISMEDAYVLDPLPRSFLHLYYSHPQLVTQTRSASRDHCGTSHLLYQQTSQAIQLLSCPMH